MSVRSSYSQSASSESDKSSSSSGSSSSAESDKSLSSKSDNEEDIDEEDMQFLQDLEAKILALRREAATAANAEDAAFIAEKIKDMEEFVKEAKIEFGMVVDTDMTVNKKHKNNSSSEGEDEASVVGNSNGENDSKPPAKKRK